MWRIAKPSSISASSNECEQPITLQSTQIDLNLILSSGNPFYFHCIDRNILYIGYRKVSDGATYQHIFFFQSTVGLSLQNSQSSKLDVPFNAGQTAVFPLITKDSLSLETLDPDYFSHDIKFAGNISKTDMSVTRGNFEPAPILNSSVFGANVSYQVLEGDPEILWFNDKVHQVAFWRDPALASVESVAAPDRDSSW